MVYTWLVCFLLIAISSTPAQTLERKHRISGFAPLLPSGTVPSKESAPFLVGILINLYDNDRGKNASGGCTGTIISIKYVLTAAHCTVFQSPKYTFINMIIIAGSNDLMDRAAVRRNVIQRIPHPMYDPNKPISSYDVYKDDIAILKLDLPLQYSRTIQPTPFPDSDTPVVTDYSILMLGFGLSSPNLLKEIENFIVVTNYTIKIGNYFSYNSTFGYQEVNDNICKIIWNRNLGFPNYDSLYNGCVLYNPCFCPGDSGGPSIYCLNQTYCYQVGVTNLGISLGNNIFPLPLGPISIDNRCGIGGLFLNVPNYLEWIKGEVDSIQGPGIFSSVFTSPSLLQYLLGNLVG